MLVLIDVWFKWSLTAMRGIFNGDKCIPRGFFSVSTENVNLWLNLTHCMYEQQLSKGVTELKDSIEAINTDSFSPEASR